MNKRQRKKMEALAAMQSELRVTYKCGCTDDARKCEVCERSTRLPDNKLQVKRFGAWLLGCDLCMCYDCFSQWYGEGKTDRDEIKAIVLGNVILSPSRSLVSELDTPLRG